MTAVSAQARTAPRVAKNPSRARLYDFIVRAAISTPTGARVLDAGAGEMLYAPLWDHTYYETADFLKVDKAYGAVDYVCDLRSIPVDDERFDAVLLTQVLEHLPEPQIVLRELLRVLKPGGRIWITTPLFYEEHEQPFDFHRYTQSGLTNHLERAGFTVEDIDWLEGSFGTLSYQARSASRFLPRSPSEYGHGPVAFSLAALAWPTAVAARAASRVFGALELKYRITSAGYPKNYTAIASKPASQK